MKRFFRYLGIFLRSILIFLVLWAFTVASVKNIESTIKIEQFKSKGVYQEDISSSFIKYYKVEGNEEKKAFQKINNVILPGSPGDIICSLHSSIKIPFIGDIITSYAGGHASLITERYYDYFNSSNETTIIESPGIDDYPSPSRIYPINYWTTNQLFPDAIVLRVNMTEKEQKEVLSFAQTMLGDPYNYSFLFNTRNSKYCSDLIVKSFEKINKNLNKDSFAVPIHDLVISDETYIVYYHYFENDVKYIYYME